MDKLNFIACLVIIAQMTDEDVAKLYTGLLDGARVRVAARKTNETINEYLLKNINAVRYDLLKKCKQDPAAIVKLLGEQNNETFDTMC